MKLVDFLSESLIISDLHSTTREGALEEIAAHVATMRGDVDRSAAFRALMDRERLGSTGIGNGFAIPHAKLPHLAQVVGSIARSRPGVSFGSLDGKPVHLLLTLLAPEGSGGGMHLKALARVSRLFKDANLRSRVIEAEDQKSIWAIVTSEDKRLASNE